MNYYPFHIGDYLSATRHLSWIEDAAYRRLLDTYYTTEKPLPADHRAVCRLVLATTDEQREAVQIVLQEFFELTPDGWINRRADAEIVEMRAKQEKQRAKANKRWHKPESEPGNATTHAPAMPQHPVNDAAAYAVASKTDADAMPPTPTPTPTPIKEKEKEKTKATAPASPAPLPDWMPKDAWQGFAAMRIKIRKPMTDRALELILAKLDRMRSEGQDLSAVLDQSTVNGWQDVFPLKAEHRTTKPTHSGFSSIDYGTGGRL